VTKITQEIGDFILDYYEEKSTNYLYEVKQTVFDEFGVHIHEDTIRKFLQRQSIPYTRKKVCYISTNRNVDQIENYKNIVSKLDLNSLCYMDEMAVWRLERQESLDIHQEDDVRKRPKSLKHNDSM
jgi:hypothetical protein